MERKFLTALLAVLLLTTAGMMGSASAADNFKQCYNACMKECGHNGSLEVCERLCADSCTPPTSSGEWHASIDAGRRV
ncbi:unnamed protein product [Linum trigynum]|uniref:Uncharacterized protein n=1 Tax=Linum trigynum TaxID=586398 RepID=A0AAV2G1T5_9ROSI